ncbi:hypothetical protein BU24DRAFT_488223 [Aaosphaeria arxii CBS 175.79]|uniref:Uncharacterized protein n=1 Tax=Aaosphaeria arxii CBS 175.79 TaxID=1450172 RepID=A0A6A5Y8J6_9PLEO|nr:uncharacterized protein BU24DRAFT_488223 [Aaosphaeria arxii CBS 175.79]KAF2021895.1 hypothetical protein BU24DRAFT_488223 [Aaosphaeria arxii CBS 175.79]
MSGSMDDLSRELTRIISCPYPASLTKLAEIALHSSDQTIQKAILDLPSCKISRLVSIVAAALPLWPYTLSLLHSLCRSADFSNELLRQNPGLPDALLAKANVVHEEFGEHNEVCICLLSRALPENVPLPLSAHSFFLRMFEKATQNPTVESLRPVYRMLNGACSNLLDLLSPELRHGFDRELCQILSSNSTGQNSMLLLWCFGIVIAAERPCSAEQVTDQYGQWRTASGRKLFGSKSGLYKTLNLTYLSVIWAVKGDVGVSHLEAVEGIRIAIRAMQFVDQETRQSWPSSSALARNIFPKLPAKLVGKDLNVAIQLEALTFFAMIAGDKNLLEEVVAQFETCLLNVSMVRVGTTTTPEILSLALPQFASTLSESTMCGFITNVLRAGSTPDSLANLTFYTALIPSLSSILSSSPVLRAKMAKALSFHEVQESLRTFLDSIKPSNHQNFHGFGCETSNSQLRKKLLSSTIAMLLTTALLTEPGEPTISHQLAIELLNKQQKLAGPLQHCSHVWTVAQPAISLFEQECTPSNSHQQDWKERLKSEMGMQTAYQHESVVRCVAQICQNLEDRCENVEEPLRVEKDKVKALTSENIELRAQAQSLETDLLDRRLCIDGLEDHIDSLENAKDDLSAKLMDLKIEFSTADRKADEVLRAAQEDFNNKEMHLHSTILTHEEAIHDYVQQIGARDEEIRCLDEKLESNAEEKLGWEQVQRDLQATIDNYQQQLDTKQTENEDQRDVIHRLTDRANDLDTRLHSSFEETKSLTQRLEKLDHLHQQLKQSSDQAMRDLSTENQEKLSITQQKADKLCAQLNLELQNALHNGQQTTDLYEEAYRDLQISRNAVKNLEDKIQDLSDTCIEKDEELHELRSLRSRVLASMGLAAEVPAPTPTNHQSKEGSRHSHRRRKSALQSQATHERARNEIDKSGNTATAMDEIANASFTSSDLGPTPKRSKPRTSFQVPIVEPSSSLDHGASSSKPLRLSPSKRPALKPMSPNRRHTTVGFTLPNKGRSSKISRRRGSMNLVDQASFDIGELISGTPFTAEKAASPMGMVLDEDEDEGTTEL